MAVSASADEAFPRKPIKVIVPFGPGGASDTTARILQEGLRREVPDSKGLAIVNVPGTGGALGSRRVLNARPDGYTILNLHDGIFTARLSGVTEYDYQAFEPIAATASSQMVLCTGPKGEWTSLKQLLEEAKAKPQSIRFGGNLGAPSHFVGLLVQHQLQGAEFKMVPLAGGAERYTKLAGSQIELSLFSASEFKDFEQSPERPDGLRAVVFLGEERHPSMPDLQTAKEEGFDLIGGSTQFWWAPKGTPQDRIEKMADLLEDAVQTDFVQTRYGERGIEPILLRGDALIAHIDQTVSRLESVNLADEPLPPSLPFVPIVAAGCLLFGLLSFIGSRSIRGGGSWTWVPVGAVVAVLSGYCLILNFRWLPYGVVTVVFAFAVGALLLAGEKRRWGILAVLALVLGFGLQFLFQNILVIDLP
ncbi:MAG: tripartite tricarboxylate transporter substrate binding protein [Verrucomicrobiota bacterium]